MAEVTIMVLKVDLGCEKCRRKIKKLLCRYHEIRDQTYFDKEDTVIITVVCCNPERIRQKLICKGRKTIKSIEIRVPEKPKPPPEKPKEAEKPKPPPEKPKEAEKPKPPPEKPKEAEKPKPADPPKADKPVEIIKPPPPAPAPAPAPSQAPLPAPVPVMAVHGYPQFFPVPMYCKPCYEVGYGGPCQHGYGTGIPYQPPSSYDGYVKLVTSYSETPAATTVGVGVGWPSSGCRCNRSYACRCEYFTEENPACTIM